MKNFKNIFKCLSIAALAGMLSMNTVNAANDGALVCGEGETVHTNYYLFLAANEAASMNEAIDKATSESTEETKIRYGIFSGANKWNNIPLGADTRQGDIPITIGLDDTTESGITESTISYLDKLGLEPWTASTFWKNFYMAHKNKDSKTNIYTKGNVSYVLHNGYWTFTDANGNGQSAIQTSPYEDLLNYLSTRVDDLTNTSLIVRSGTNLPYTFLVAPTADFGKAASENLSFRVNRYFDTSDKKSGIDLQNGQKAVVYSPAVYFVQFCANATGNIITYHPNTTDTVTDMPESPQELDSKKCGDTSTKIPKRKGYTFLGWSEDPDSTTGDFVKAGDKVNYCGSSIVLYAIWAKDEYTVKYHATNGSKDAPKDATGTPNSCVTIAGGPKLSGNTFLGWAFKESSGEPDFKEGDKYCGEKGDIELYSVWKNSKTGVSAHVVAFGLMAAAAVGGLVLAKKKNLFKQI